VTADCRVDLFLLGRSPREVVDHARAAEQAGFAGVWLAEHHFISYGRCPSATVMAGYVLGATQRIAVGTAACVLSNRHPVALGEEAALLDAVAPGRFRLGVARGGPWVDLEVFGTGLRRYERGFAESLDVLLRWLSGSASVSADGEFFSFRDVAVVPRPAQALPVWVAATSNSTVDIAARRGLPLLLGVHDDDAAKAAMVRRHGGAVEHGSVHLVSIADSAAEARQRLRKPLREWLSATSEYVRIDGAASPRRDLDAYVEHLLDIHAFGTPEECAARLAESLAQTGARRLLLMVEAHSTMEAIRQLSPLVQSGRPTARRGAGTGSPPG
jgi:alkanesulfonate monooxygenase SsuD/methylene tetrahydromethanopterin reductase-like flavin-dependent oxidoreductase (luciferase family)